jgi:hypothetical protein
VAFAEPCMTLEQFEETFFKPYMMTREQYHTECAVAFDHEESLPKPEPAADPAADAGAAASGSAVRDS